MKIAIVEDNDTHRQQLYQHLLTYGKEMNVDFSVDFYTDGIQIIHDFKSEYDIIYLDVEMEVMDGMTTAAKIREYDEKVAIVFVTNFVQWAIEGYAVNATDFLLKPLSYFNFQEHFKKIQKSLESRQQQSLVVKSNSGLRKINLNDLYFIESEGHYLHFNMKEEVFSILETMKNLEQKLKDYDFFRCNNYYLVNLKHVSSVEKNLAVVGTHSLQISRPRKKDFMTALTDYIGEGLT